MSSCKSRFRYFKEKKNFKRTENIREEVFWTGHRTWANMRGEQGANSPASRRRQGKKTFDEVMAGPVGGPGEPKSGLQVVRQERNIVHY